MLNTQLIRPPCMPWRIVLTRRIRQSLQPLALSRLPRGRQRCVLACHPPLFRQTYLLTLSKEGRNQSITPDTTTPSPSLHYSSYQPYDYPDCASPVHPTTTPPLLSNPEPFPFPYPYPYHHQPQHQHQHHTSHHDDHQSQPSPPAHFPLPTNFSYTAAYLQSAAARPTTVTFAEAFPLMPDLSSSSSSSPLPFPALPQPGICCGEDGWKKGRSGDWNGEREREMGGGEGGGEGEQELDPAVVLSLVNLRLDYSAGGCAAAHDAVPSGGGRRRHGEGDGRRDDDYGGGGGGGRDSEYAYYQTWGGRGDRERDGVFCVGDGWGGEGKKRKAEREKERELNGGKRRDKGKGKEVESGKGKAKGGVVGGCEWANAQHSNGYQPVSVEDVSDGEGGRGHGCAYGNGNGGGLERW